MLQKEANLGILKKIQGKKIGKKNQENLFLELYMSTSPYQFNQHFILQN